MTEDFFFLPSEQFDSLFWVYHLVRPDNISLTSHMMDNKLYIFSLLLVTGDGTQWVHYCLGWETEGSMKSCPLCTETQMSICTYQQMNEGGKKENNVLIGWLKRQEAEKWALNILYYELRDTTNIFCQGWNWHNYTYFLKNTFESKCKNVEVLQRDKFHSAKKLPHLLPLNFFPCLIWGAVGQVQTLGYLRHVVAVEEMICCLSSSFTH